MKSQGAVPSDPWAPSQLPPAQQKEAKWLTWQLRMKAVLGSGSCSCSPPGWVGIVPKGAAQEHLLLNSVTALPQECHGIFGIHGAVHVPLGVNIYLLRQLWQLSPLLTSITVTPLRYQLLGMWDNIFFQAILDTLLLLLFYVFNHFKADLGHD